MKRNAYAKINLDLHITGRRADGYHTLETTMQSVSLFDTLSYVKTTRPLCFTCSDISLANEKNLCVKAAEKFFASVGLSPVGRLHLTKRVPYGAGLGGGSSDAAAVLRLLNEAFENPLDDKALLSLASLLGADVAFCLHGGKAGCRGIGDEMTTLPDDQKLLVIAKGKDGLSTPEMYRLFDENGVQGNSENDFEPIAAAKLPEIGYLVERIKAGGASDARMTGSGSAVFGVFSSLKKARETAKELRTRGFFAKVCRTIPRY